MVKLKSVVIFNLRNPMCSVFPTEVSCDLPNVGAAGKEQVHNGLCVLTQVTGYIHSPLIYRSKYTEILLHG